MCLSYDEGVPGVQANGFQGPGYARCLAVPVLLCRCVTPAVLPYTYRSSKGLYDSSSPAVELVNVYFEDPGVPAGIANMGIRRALWPFVQKTEVRGPEGTGPEGTRPCTGLRSVGPRGGRPAAAPPYAPCPSIVKCATGPCCKQW